MRSRHVVLALVIATGAVAACLEIAARAEAARLAASLAPLATLTYASAGISLDGSARLREPRLAWPGGAATARVAYVRRPGLFWLVGGWFRDDAERFASLDMDVRGLALEGATADAMKDWWGTPVLAPFESLGCNEGAFDAGDRHQMGVEVGERRDEVSYRYDIDRQRVDLALDLDAPGVSRLRVRAEIAAFTPDALAEDSARGDVRLSRAEVAYRDEGYFARRNHYCAQRLSITPAQFVDRHLAAVEAFLATRGIEPGTDIRTAYRRLVERGGTLAFASVPDPGWAPERHASESRAELLRLLSVTMRHDDTPPVMLRLAFSDPVGTPATDVPDANVPEIAGATGSPGPLAPTMSPAAPGPTPAPTPPPAAARTLAPDVAEPAAAAIAATPEAGPPREVVAVAPAATPAPVPVQSPAGNVAAAPEAREAPSPVLPPSTDRPSASAPGPGRSIGEERLGASAPRPPEGSTLAMVWREGVVERLAPRTEQGPDHDVVPVGSLGQRLGQRVRIVTRGGKVIEGRVREVDGSRVTLAVRVGGGDAAMAVPLSNIREARVPRRAGAP
ncbi:hypothetical protein ACQQ2N_06705 [Dokdonella sp. MW10]|uniref:hypothetical protein n=1 Tax=Dokdonella sp. MW10 TaxID=2992926 RepID=UPI003F7EA54E